jgi:hypothetical protein
MASRPEHPGGILNWDAMLDQYREQWRVCARAAIAALARHFPADEVVVPMEPTEAMLAAAGYADATEDGKEYVRFRYRAMVEAALTEDEK